MSVLRPDRFFSDALKGIFGPATIVGNSDCDTLLPQIGYDSKIEYHCDTADFRKYTSSGDIIYLDGKGGARVMLSSLANANTILVTEQCDNFCMFCSQPPKPFDDSFLLSQAALALIQFDSDKLIGITGGEPLLYKEKFLSFLKTLSNAENNTPLHILSNGRALKNIEYARKLRDACEDRYIILGIPVYSSSSEIHDKLVGKKGAWLDTIAGVINACSLGFKIELRIIPTKWNIEQIVPIIQILGNSLSTISSISVMNLEHTGLARKNWRELYVAPKQYWEHLKNAEKISQKFGIPFVLYNFPLCQLEIGLRKYSTKSISDWKNSYDDSCQSCLLKSECCGFFISESFRETIPILEVE